jgi:hypothetical protein
MAQRGLGNLVDVFVIRIVSGCPHTHFPRTAQALKTQEDREGNRKKVYLPFLTLKNDYRYSF